LGKEREKEKAKTLVEKSGNGRGPVFQKRLFFGGRGGYV